MPDVVMPRLSDSMEEGTILKWLKAAGEEVSRGDELVEIETDKATMTYEADADGALEIVAEEGSTLPVGEVIARIGAAAGAPAPAGGDAAGAAAPGGDEAGPDGAGEAADAVAAAVPGGDEDGTESGGGAEGAFVATAPAGDEGGRAGAGGNGRSAAKASPVARRIARERGVDLATLEGTGPGGRIVKADVEAAAGIAARRAVEPAAEPAAAPEPQRAPAPGTTEAPEPQRAPGAETGKGEVTVREPSRIQQIVARRMAESKATIPHFTMSTDVDMEAAVAMREQLRALAEGQGTAVPSYNDMVVKACAIALREHPLVNGSYRDGRHELHGRVNIGVAVAGEGTLIVPTIFDADRKGLGQIAEESRALAAKAREGRITPPELSGGTFSITNLGMYGVTTFAAVVNPPQAAILAVGAMAPRAVVHDGGLTARHTLTMTLSADHRILSGAPAAEFLARVKAILEQPVALAL